MKSRLCLITGLIVLAGCGGGSSPTAFFNVAGTYRLQRVNGANCPSDACASDERLQFRGFSSGSWRFYNNTGSADTAYGTYTRTNSAPRDLALKYAPATNTGDPARAFVADFTGTTLTMTGPFYKAGESVTLEFSRITQPCSDGICAE